MQVNDAVALEDAMVLEVDDDVEVARRRAGRRCRRCGPDRGRG